MIDAVVTLIINKFCKKATVNWGRLEQTGVNRDAGLEPSETRRDTETNCLCPDTTRSDPLYLDDVSNIRDSVSLPILQNNQFDQQIQATKLMTDLPSNWCFAICHGKSSIHYAYGTSHCLCLGKVIVETGRKMN